MVLRSHALRSALGWAIGVAIVALLAGSVRVLPWLFDPSVPFRVAVPFTKTLIEAALEAALAVGWPIGWALSAQLLVERGESRVLALLGERPRQTLARLAPQGALLAAVLAIVSGVSARDGKEPGRLAQQLVDQARAACAHERPSVQVVPFVNAVWLCRDDAEPRLYAMGPGGLPVTGESIQLSGDLREIDIADARLRFHTASFPIGVQANALALRGLPAWGHASRLAPIAYGFVSALSVLVAACAAVLVVLRRMARSRLGAFAVGAAGPLAMLGVTRALDRADARAGFYALLPLATTLVVLVIGALVSRLLGRKRPDRV